MLGDHAPPPEVAVEARELLERVARLKPQQRVALGYRMAGVSYEEAAADSGHTYTWINRHITEGRAALREDTVTLPNSEMEERIKALGERARERGDVRAAQPVVTRRDPSIVKPAGERSASTEKGPIRMDARQYAPKTCKGCGSEFTPGAPRQVYCSADCRPAGGSEKPKETPNSRTGPKPPVAVRSRAPEPSRSPTPPPRTEQPDRQSIAERYRNLLLELLGKDDHREHALDRLFRLAEETGDPVVLDRLERLVVA